MIKSGLMAATMALFALLAADASAQPAYAPPPAPDPYGYYSQYDQTGYYTRSGAYIRPREQGGRPERDVAPPPPPPPEAGHTPGAR